MNNAYFSFPMPSNEPVRAYAPGSDDAIQLQAAIKELKGKKRDIPMYIAGKEVRTDKKVDIYPPHERAHL